MAPEKKFTGTIRADCPVPSGLYDEKKISVFAPGVAIYDGMGNTTYTEPELFSPRRKPVEKSTRTLTYLNGKLIGVCCQNCTIGKDSDPSSQDRCTSSDYKKVDVVKAISPKLGKYGVRPASEDPNDPWVDRELIELIKQGMRQDHPYHFGPTPVSILFPFSGNLSCPPSDLGIELLRYLKDAETAFRKHDFTTIVGRGPFPDNNDSSLWTGLRKRPDIGLMAEERAVRITGKHLFVPEGEQPLHGKGVHIVDQEEVFINFEKILEELDNSKGPLDEEEPTKRFFRKDVPDEEVSRCVTETARIVLGDPEPPIEPDRRRYELLTKEEAGIRFTVVDEVKTGGKSAMEIAKKLADTLFPESDDSSRYDTEETHHDIEDPETVVSSFTAEKRTTRIGFAFTDEDTEKTRELFSRLNRSEGETHETPRIPTPAITSSGGPVRDPFNYKERMRQFINQTPPTIMHEIITQETGPPTCLYRDFGTRPDSPLVENTEISRHKDFTDEPGFDDAEADDNNQPVELNIRGIEE